MKEFDLPLGVTAISTNSGVFLSLEPGMNSSSSWLNREEVFGLKGGFILGVWESMMQLFMKSSALIGSASSCVSAESKVFSTGTSILALGFLRDNFGLGLTFVDRLVPNAVLGLSLYFMISLLQISELQSMGCTIAPRLPRLRQLRLASMGLVSVELISSLDC